MFPLFIYCTRRHCLLKCSLLLMLDSVFTLRNSENKRTYSTQVRLHYFLSKNVIFLIFIYFKSIFYHFKLFYIYIGLVIHIFRTLSNSVYFQNIVVCKKAFRLLFYHYLYTFTWLIDSLLSNFASIINPFSTNVSLMQKPGSRFLLAKCLKTQHLWKVLNQIKC